MIVPYTASGIHILRMRDTEMGVEVALRIDRMCKLTLRIAAQPLDDTLRQFADPNRVR